MTPEGKVKRKIKAVLDRYRVEHGLYYYMPVPAGYGASSLDYLGFFAGFGFAIEAKRPGAKPTPRQDGTIERIERAGAVVFVINDEDSLAILEDWCKLRASLRVWTHASGSDH